MPRLTFGPAVEDLVIMRNTFGPDVPDLTVDAPVLPDLALTLVSSAKDALVVNVPDHDPAAVAVPTTVTAVYFAGTFDPAATPDDVLALPGALLSAAVPVAAAGDLAITPPALAPGVYAIKLVLSFSV